MRPLVPLPPPIAAPADPRAPASDSERWLTEKWPTAALLQRVDRPSGKGPFRRVTVIQPRSLPYPVRIEEAVTSENGREIVVAREEIVANRFIVRLSADTPAAIAALTAATGASEIIRLSDIGIFRVLLPTALADSVPAALDKVTNSRLPLRYAEADAMVHTQATPDDPRYADGSQWGLHNTGQSAGTSDADIDAPEAWDTLTDATGVIVAVVDTGVRYTHEDLAANCWINPGEIPENGIDDDNNNAADDVHGFNALTAGNDPMDDNGHGTHCAGVIAAVGNNAKGIAGIAWSGAKIMPAKFLGSDGSGSLSDALRCLQYARLNGAKIISNSWGGGAASQSLLDEIAACRAADIILVIAAGNDDSDNDALPTYPSSYQLENIVSVAATSRNDNRAVFSNFGIGSVNIGAPGLDILSTYGSSDTAYENLSGTSMATPAAAGVLTLLKARFPADSSGALINRLYRSVDVISSLATVTQTSGRVNLQKALASTTNRTPNDHFSEAYPLGTTTQVLRMNNAAATEEINEPAHAGISAQKTVWYRWTATSNAPVIFSTLGSSYDTTLATYTGSSVSSLTPVAANDDDSENSRTTSRLRLVPVSGTTYHIAIGSKSGTEGLLMINVGPAPANDDFAQAITLSGSSFATTGTTLNAAKEVGEPAHADLPGGASVWYRWTAPSTGNFAVTTVGGTSFDTLLAIYTGTSIDALTPLAANDDASASYSSSRVLFAATAGTTYHIAIDGKNGASGNFRLTISSPPANDNFATATAIPTSITLPYATTGTNRGAWLEAGEPEIVSVNQPGGPSVWWKWTAPASLDYLVNTIGSDYDTMLAIYTGPNVGSLLKLSDNDDIDPRTLQSRVTLPAVAGVTYYIRVDGWRGRSGSITLNITAPIIGWGNDNLAQATELEGPSAIATGSNVGSSVEAPGEPILPNYPAGTVIYRFDSAWWRWTAPATGTARLSSQAITLTNAYAQVFRVVNSALPVTFSNLASHAFMQQFTNTATLSFAATRGTTYYFRLGQDNSFARANFAFRVDYSPALTNKPPVITAAILNASGTVDATHTLGLATLTATDPESNPITYSYQWQRSPDRETWTDHPAATAATLAPLPGYFWQLKVRPSDATGNGVWFTTAAVAVDSVPVTTATHGLPYSYTSGLAVPAPLPPARLPCIINEVSKGTSGTRRWLEILTQQNTDLRGYILATSYGGAKIFFGTTATVWQTIPAGTLIVIYNGADRDPALPPDDTDVSDGRLILADTNKTFFPDFTTNNGFFDFTQPGTDGTSFWGDTYLGPGNSSVLYQGRGIKIYTPAYGVPFGLEWGGQSGTGAYLPTFNPTFSTGQSLRYIGGNLDQAEISSGWELAASTADVVSPGRANSTANEDLVLRLRAQLAPRFRLASTPVPGLALDSATGTLSGAPLVPAGGVFSITIERFHAYDVARRTFTLTIISPLQVWRTDNGLPADGLQDLLTPANDGVPNILKYAFNMIGTGTGQAVTLATPNINPLAPAGFAGLPLATAEALTGKLQLTYIRRKATSHPGINYAVEFSDALTSWDINATATESVTDIDSTFERVTVTDSTTPANRFVRVRVTTL